jgi:hypothetical protein
MKNLQLFADISDYQSTFRAVSYKSAGHKLIVIKAGEGVGIGGATNHDNRTNAAHQVGLSVWHYWFLDPSIDPRQQAAACVKALSGFKVGDRVVIDTESLSVAPAEGCRVAVEMRLALASYGHPHAILYTFEAYVTDELYVEGAEYWIAQYDGTFKRPDLDRKFNIIAKQYTDSVHGENPKSFAGIGPCDGSIFL